MITFLSAIAQPLVYVPMAALLLLLGLIWLMGSDRKLKISILWFATYILVCAGLLAVAYVQKASGCDLSLGDCYSDQLPEGFWVIKFVAVLLYELWAISAVFSIARRLLGVSDSASKKYVLIALGLLSIIIFSFVLYFRSLNG